MNEKIGLLRKRCEEKLAYFLERYASSNSKLQDAINYALIGKGKRLRALLVYGAGDVVGADYNNLDVAACAIEMVHCFSLIHDDLPSMDNDDYRRGQLATHRKFDEATAILAGNALQSLAFTIIADSQSWTHIEFEKRCQMSLLLGSASGLNGMISGQACDLELSCNEAGIPAKKTHVHSIFARKTACLMQASVGLGALCSNHCSAETNKALDEFAYAFGMSFQLKDDLEDIDDSFDQSTAKPDLSYVRLFGQKATLDAFKEYRNVALNALEPLREQAQTLVELTGLGLDVKSV